MSDPLRPPAAGDRYRDDDPRSPGRIIQLLERLEDGRWRYVVDEHPSNQSAIGTKRPISEHTLRTRFTRVSR